MLTLDGSQGEGGGQIVRTALTLSCITGTPVCLENIRTGRSPGGLRPQHLTAVKAAADLCHAAVEGAEIGSEEIVFIPGDGVRPGDYEWSINTAGATTLIMQTVLVPLALTGKASSVKINGGTHVSFSPSGHYLRDVYIPTLLNLGIDAELYIEAYGWMPEGGGTLSAFIKPGSKLHGADMNDRGEIERVIGVGVSSNLPSHIPQRITNRAINLLETPLRDAVLDIRPVRTSGLSTGAGLFLAVEYTNGRGGFGMIGRKGMPSEVVAEKAVSDLLSFHASEAAVDAHLADQLIVPLALAPGESVFSTEAISSHLTTNIAVVRAFLDRPIVVDEEVRTVTLG